MPMRDQDTAFLSARVPARLKNRFKSLAARKGTKIQDLLTEIIGEYVAREDRVAVTAAEAIRRLRAMRPALEAAGIAHLHLFGSVARGEARADSDIDLAYTPAPKARLSLIDLGRLAQKMSQAFEQETEIDLVPLASLKPHVRETAEADMISVF